MTIAVDLGRKATNKTKKNKQQNAIGEAQTLMLKSSTLLLIHCAHHMLWNELKYLMTYFFFLEKQFQYRYTCTDPGIFARGRGGGWGIGPFLPEKQL